MSTAKRRKLSHRSEPSHLSFSTDASSPPTSVSGSESKKNEHEHPLSEPPHIESKPSSNLAPFFRLPRELRDEIYMLLLPKCLYGQDGSTDKEMLECPTPVYLWEKGNLQILRVNRQMNWEAEEIFWGTNTFHMILDSRSPRLTITYGDPYIKNGVRSAGTKKIWSDRMEPKLRLMRSLVVTIPTHFARYRCVYDRVPWYILDIVEGMKRISRTDAVAFFGNLMRAEAASQDKLNEMYRHGAGKQRENRMRYKNDILYGFSRFLSLFQLADDDSRFKFFELSFHSYLNWEGLLIGPSLATRESVEQKVPKLLMRRGNAINVRVIRPHSYD
jgi:hypothetical protein